MTRTSAPSPGARVVLARRGLLALLVLAGVGGCGAAGPRARAPVVDDARDDTRRAAGRPPLVVIAREGDPRSAVAIAMATQGIAPERGAEATVALAALVESRVDHAVSVVPSRDGVRARGLAANEPEATALVESLRGALLGPVIPAELAPVRRKLAMLARRPIADPALEAASQCAGEASRAGGADAELTVEALEAWRRAAAGLGRVAMATVGSAQIGDAVASELAKGPAWPAASAIAPDAPLAGDARVYDATGDTLAGGARVTLAARAPRADQAVHAAEALGDPHGALAARLGGLDAPARLRDVTAAAHARGGCVVVTFELGPRELAVDAPARVATAVALARQEIATELAAAQGDPGAARAIARRSGDPRDAAELAAWWALSEPDPSAEGEVRIATAVGLASGRDVGADSAVTARAAAIRGDLDRAVLAWHEPVIDVRTRVEKGQGELWLALGSPCGTIAEMESDAGLTAAFALAAADRTSDALRDTGARAEAWAAPDGIGVVVHGPPLAGESPESHARRLADAVARSFAAEPIDRASVSRARARLLGADERDDARALVTLAEALVPGHPSWIAPMGPLEGLGRSSDAAVASRASAVRAGPLRVAVLANATDEQADAAVRAVDRWIARRPGDTRACPAPSTPAPARPSTYAVDAAPGGASQAWLGIALPAGDAPALAAAEWIAAALDGADGMLARALGGGLARTWSARVVGSARASALVVRVDSAAGALDAAVAQVRALLDRVRQGSLGEGDRARAMAALASRDLAAALDPGRRLASLWRGAPAVAAPPTLDALRAFASATLRDDALVIVAVRPPRAPKS